MCSPPTVRAGLVFAFFQQLRRQFQRAMQALFGFGETDGR
jgi:hypothetical protein